jgi:nucleoside-diphosphate-sugar epimerase
MKKLKIAILGSNSHIAKGLLSNFLKAQCGILYLFTRSPEIVAEFLRGVEDPGGNTLVKNGYNDFKKIDYDVIINCVGAGTPNKLKDNYSNWFTINEKFDNLVLDYLFSKPETLYVNFSSGAVYGRDNSAPRTADTENRITVNAIEPADYYSIVNLNSEAKHRSFKDLKIADIRIFSYFSRFADLDSGYFITELISHILQNRVLQTTDVNIVRDYIHPRDLFLLIMKCIEAGKINTVFDAVSAHTVDKMEILEYFSKYYALKYKVNGELDIAGPNGTNNIYCSAFNKAKTIGYIPKFSSMDTLKQEAKFILAP